MKKKFLKKNLKSMFPKLKRWEGREREGAKGLRERTNQKKSQLTSQPKPPPRRETNGASEPEKLVEEGTDKPRMK